LTGKSIAVHPDKNCSVAPILPSSGIQSNLLAGTITHNTKKELSMTQTAEPMKQCMVKKHD